MDALCSTWSKRIWWRPRRDSNPQSHQLNIRMTHVLDLVATGMGFRNTYYLIWIHYLPTSLFYDIDSCLEWWHYALTFRSLSFCFCFPWHCFQILCCLWCQSAFPLLPEWHQVRRSLFRLAETISKFFKCILSTLTVVIFMVPVLFCKLYSPVSLIFMAPSETFVSSVNHWEKLLRHVDE